MCGGGVCGGDPRGLIADDDFSIGLRPIGLAATPIAAVLSIGTDATGRTTLNRRGRRLRLDVRSARTSL